LAKYIQTLESGLLPFLLFIFQQDNTSVHTSRETKEWFIGKNIHPMYWPSLIPDLNPIENVWGILVHKIYDSVSQFSTVGELK
jgi:transposase